MNSIEPASEAKLASSGGHSFAREFRPWMTASGKLNLESGLRPQWWPILSTKTSRSA
jgi:hypothetical protein